MTKADLLRHLARVPMNAVITFGSRDDGLRAELIERAFLVYDTGYGMGIELTTASGRDADTEEDDGTEELFCGERRA